MNDKIFELIKSVLSSDLPISTRNEVARHYLLPPLGRTQAIIENDRVEVGTVERPTKEEIDIESNPKLKAEFEDFEALDKKNQEKK